MSWMLDGAPKSSDFMDYNELMDYNEITIMKPKE